MRCLFVCADDFLWRLAGERGETRLAPIWIVEEPRLRARIVERESRLRDRFEAAHPQVPTVTVPALAGDVHDLDGLRQVGTLLAGERPT